MSENNYVVYHLHSDLSNGTMMDAASKYIDYIIRAKELGMRAIAFSEHGNVYNWISKKMSCDEYGLKYIHGMEAYITTTLDEKLREAYHLGIYAKNWEGVKELNRLSSNSFNKDDNHFFYRPRLSLEEVLSTSDNIIITSACLGSLLNKENEYVGKLIDFMVRNKHRCFFEIQYHSDPEQVAFNQFLYKKSLETGVPLIAGTDTHALNEKRAKLRLVLQKSKNINFSSEDTYDLTFKSYDELVEMFEKQNSLPMDVVLEAINNTNKLADMVEDFNLDLSHKYPKIYDGEIEELKLRINEGVKSRGIHLYPKEKKDLYFKRIREEFDIMQGMGNLSYFLLLDDIIKFCKSKNIGTAPRGSCNGSLILWVLGITDIDSIKYELPFFRFLNPSRVSLADVDIDMSGKRRDEVKDFLYNYPGINGSAIITYQTFQWKGATKAIGRGLEIPLSIVDMISKDIEEVEEEDDNGETKTITTFHNKEKWMKEYPELMELVEEAIGLIENVSVHACGFVVSDRNLDEELGTFRTDKSKWPISQNNMKAVDASNFVKMDLLVVDNVQMVEDVCGLAGVGKLENDGIDFEDENVWNEMRKSGLGIFQFEKTGWRYLNEALENYDKFKSNSNGKMSRLDMMTALNGIIRPAGDSIRDNFVKGIPHDNKIKEINVFLSKTLGYLIYQEQIMTWLNEFCAYDMAQSDMVRRGIAKKGGTEKLTPEIKQGFLDYCSEKFDYPLDHLNKVVDENLKVIKDASDYGFSENHSCPYSILGFKGAYLRHYYPLEFITTQLIINENKKDKTTKIVEFMKNHTDIKILPIKFRKSRSGYIMSKSDNAIYKGIKSIKDLSEAVAEELYALRDNKYDTFIDLLVDINDNTKTNKSQALILIKLNFFSEFGNISELVELHKQFYEGEHKYKKSYVEKTREARLSKLRLLENSIKSSGMPEMPPNEVIMFQKEMLGYADKTYPNVESSWCVVTDLDTKYSPKLKLYSLKKGEEKQFKMDKKTFKSKDPSLQINKGDLIKITDFKKKHKQVPDGSGGFVPTKQIEYWITGYQKYNKENLTYEH
ncbi:PHP domain-containing protein [Paenibacillus sp. JSM ZJ436]|uniref:PHP domain-containing protein n=1 Tax=Paenibacillus sp. JSM ZJ436 TaxID=3376190 RepID=UPI0037A2B47D